MKIYLDDERVPVEGWTLVKSVGEVIPFLEAGVVTDLSLDHDLGENQPTGYDLLNWIERKLHQTNDARFIPRLYIHSMNPVGAANMRAAIESIYRYVDQIG